MMMILGVVGSRLNWHYWGSNIKVAGSFSETHYWKRMGNIHGLSCETGLGCLGICVWYLEQPVRSFTREEIWVHSTFLPAFVGSSYLSIWLLCADAKCESFSTASREYWRAHHVKSWAKQLTGQQMLSEVWTVQGCSCWGWRPEEFIE